jgi:hypothetical protein
MKPSLRIPHWIAMLLLIWTAACSASPENHNATSNNNAAPAAQAADANPPAVTAQPATPLASATPPVASPAPTPRPSAPTAATKPATETAVSPAPKATEAHVNGPKLVVVSQEKDLDFGKQPQDKSLVRPIRIKNGGNVALNIESVSPS